MRHSATLQIPNKDDLTIGISPICRNFNEKNDEPMHLRTSYFQTNTHVYMHMKHDHICAASDPHHWIHLPSRQIPIYTIPIETLHTKY